MRKLSGLLPIFIILSILGMFLGRAIFAGKVLLPADMLLKELPWQCYSAPSYPQNHYVGDALHAFYPVKAVIHERLRNGEFPLWLSEVSCGYPLFAGGFHDVISLSGFLLLLASTSLAHNLLFVLQLFLAGTFMYLYLRTMEAGFWGALVSAVAFMFNFLFMSYLLFEHIVGAMLWLPLICLLLEKFRTEGRYIYLCSAGLFMGVAILNGSIQSMLYVFLAVAIYFAYYAYCATRDTGSLRPLLRGALFFSLMALIGLGVAAVKLIPAFEFFLGWNQRSGGFNPGKWLATLWKRPLVVPLFSGFVFPDMIGSHRALDVAKILGHMGGREAMSGEVFKAYIGILPFIFALVSVFYRRCEKTKLFIWMSVIPILLILFTPLYLFLYFRGFVIYVFAVSVLAGLGIDWLINSEDRGTAIQRVSKKLRWLLAAGFAALVGGNVFLYIFRDKLLTAGHNFIKAHIANAGWLNYDLDWHLSKVDSMLAHYSIFNHRMYLPFLIGALGLVLLWAFGKGRMGTMVFMPAVIIITFLDLARLGWDYIPMVDRSIVFPETESVKFLKRDQGLFRVASKWDKMKDPSVFPPNTLLPYGISDIKAYASLIPRQGFMTEKFYDLLNVKYVLVAPATQMPREKYRLVFDRDIWIYKNKRALPRSYMVHRVKSVETEEQALAEMHRDTFNPREYAVLTCSGNLRRLDVPVSSSSLKPFPKACVKIAHYEPAKVEIDVNTMEAGFLILSDRYYPGWKAFVDGAKSDMYKANCIFRAVRVDAGRHRVTFRFSPFLFRFGLCISILSVTIIVICMLGGRIWYHRT